MSTPKILVTRTLASGNPGPCWPKVGDVTFRDPDTTMSHDEFMAAARGI